MESRVQFGHVKEIAVTPITHFSSTAALPLEALYIKKGKYGKQETVHSAGYKALSLFTRL